MPVKYLHTANICNYSEFGKIIIIIIIGKMSYFMCNRC